MQFKTVFAALVVAATAVSAAPRPVASFNDGSALAARAKKTASGQNKFLATPFAGQSKVNVAAARQRAKNAANNKAAQAGKGKGGNQSNNAGGSSAAAAAGGSAADSSAAAASASSAAAAAASSSAAAAASTGTAEQDSGVATVAEGCTSADGSSGCFEFLNVLGSCFTIPEPLANNVQFFLPPPAINGTSSPCTLFSDEDCTVGGVAGQGAVSNPAQNSYICNATAAAA